MTDTSIIVSDPSVCGGAPCIDKTRMTCANVISLLGDPYADLGQFRAEYPHISVDAIRQCAVYCAEKRCQIEGVISYCEQCSLERDNDDLDPHEKHDYWLRAAQIVSVWFGDSRYENV